MPEQNKWSTRNLDLAKGGVLLLIVLVLAIIYFTAPSTISEQPAPTQAAVTLTSPEPTTSTQALGATQPASTAVVVQSQAEPDGTVTLSGSARPGSTVELWAGETKLVEVPVDENGTWTYASQLPPGEYEVVATTVNPQGEMETVSETVILSESGSTATPSASVSPVQIASISVEGGTVSVSGSAEYGLTIELWAGETRLAAAPVNSDGSWNATMLLDEGGYRIIAREVNAEGQTLGESQPVAVTVTGAPAVTVNKPQVDDSGRVYLTGSAEPGSTVVIVQDGAVVATSTVEEDGNWAINYQTDPGDHTLSVDVTSPSGETTSVSSTSFTVPHSQGGFSYIVKRGDWLKQLARRFYGNPNRWIDIFNATNAKAAVDHTYHVIVNPNYLLPGWKIWIPEL